jgi:hypothetical protein
MRTAVRKSVMSGRSTSESTTRLRFLANRRTTITLGSLFLGILLTPLAGAQVTPSATKPISAEAMAVHLTAKRPVAASATTPTPAASSAGYLPASIQNRVRDQDLSGQDQVVTYFLHHHL